MSNTIHDVRHRLKRLSELSEDNRKLGDIDCEFVLQQYDKAIAALKAIYKEDTGDPAWFTAEGCLQELKELG